MFIFKFHILRLHIVISWCYIIELESTRSHTFFHLLSLFYISISLDNTFMFSFSKLKKFVLYFKILIKTSVDWLTMVKSKEIFKNFFKRHGEALPLSSFSTAYNIARKLPSEIRLLLELPTEENCLSLHREPYTSDLMKCCGVRPYPLILIKGNSTGQSSKLPIYFP